MPLRFRGAAVLTCLGLVLAGCSVGEERITTVGPTTGITTATPVQVLSVIDGDTLRVQMPDESVEKVRLIGIDTPEVAHPPEQPEAECYGPEAAEMTRHLIGGQPVRLESDPAAGERDRYGRLLAHVWLPDETLLASRLLSGGYGHEYTYQGQEYRYRNDFRADQRVAVVMHTGLWTMC